MGYKSAVDDAMTLHEAAAELGVHYMTAYRYVRLGQLPAHKVGGVWQVGRDDLDSFREPDPLATPEQPVLKGRNRRVPWDKRLEQRLIAGDAAGSWSVLEAAMAAGADLETCYLDVIAPAMRSIGDRWAAGEIDVAVEHLATSIATRLVSRLGARSFRRGRSRGTVLLGAVQSERHSMPLALLADLVRLQGWDIVDLGADVPVASFVHAADRIGEGLVAVGVSVTVPESLSHVLDTFTGLRAVVASDVALVAGGLAVTSDAEARALGADCHAGDARQFCELLDKGALKVEQVFD